MPGEIFDFEWFVHNEGYNWLETDATPDTAAPLEVPNGSKAGKKQPWITVAGEPTSINLMARRKYYPLRDYSCLFRIFAEISLEPKGIIAFADQYGLLGVELDTLPGRVKPFFGTAEPVAAWEGEVMAIRSALALWDMVTLHEYQALEEYLLPFVEVVRGDLGGSGPAGGKAIGLDGRSDLGELRWFRTHPEILELFESGEHKLIALGRVQAIVNEHLGSRVSPRILWDDYRKGDWGLYFVPDNLAGAIWIQFAQAITENRDYRRCRQCDSWFEIDHYKARTNRYFCSNACRSKAYRERQQEARDMAAAGINIKDIAARLGSEVETVVGWIR